MKKDDIILGIAVIVMLLFLVAGGLMVGKVMAHKSNVIEVIEYLPKGSVIAYETFRGTRVPILADGMGGSTRWVADVPWGKFTIEEKMHIVASGGGASIFGQSDIDEIIEKYTKK